MKKIKIALGALTVVVALGGAFAFKSAKLFPENLFYKTNAITPVCTAATATSHNTGTVVTNPSNFGSGYFTTSNCTGSTVTGFVPTAQ
jgi:hypothetical protein